MRYSDTNEVCGCIIVCTQQLFQLPVLYEQMGHRIHQVHFNSKEVYWLDCTLYSTTENINYNDTNKHYNRIVCEYFCLRVYIFHSI